VSETAKTGLELAEYADLLAALGLSTAIGLERELRQHSAGLRTHTLVGLGAALLMLVSKFGFFDVVQPEHVVLDPSRIAAQIVSGIGFIGGGLIFVRRDAVRGLTTAATIWVSAAVGMACGAGLLILAVVATAAHFLVVSIYPPLMRAVHAHRPPSSVRVDYRDGEGVLRRVLVETTDLGFSVSEVTTARQPEVAGRQRVSAVSVEMRVTGRRPLADLVAALSEVDGVLGVSAGEPDEEDE
jgi:putative Mg2+ transporter-C (MgtC) family protein